MGTKNRQLKTLLVQSALLSVLLTPVTLIQAYAVVPDPVSTTHLVGQWTFDTCILGKYNTDWAGYGDTATLVGNPTCGTGGQVGPGALTLNGTSQYASVPDNALFSPTATGFTVSAWVYVTAAPSRTQYIWNDYGGGVSNLVSLFLNDTNGKAYPGISYQDNTGTNKLNVVMSGTNNISLGAWHLITATLNYTGGVVGTATATLYVDGANKGTTSGNFGSVTTNDGNPPIIGNSLVDGGTYLTGLIDDVRIYNTALQSSDVAALYNFTGTTKVTSPLRFVGPVVLAGSPTGFLPATTNGAPTTSTTISVVTDEQSTCGYSLIPGTAFASMTPFTSKSDAYSSSSTVPVVAGINYFYYVKCQDASNFIDTTDYSFYFSILGAPDTSISSGSLLPTDRIVDWTKAGVPGGIPTLPFTTATTMPDGTVITPGQIRNVKTQYGAKGDGATNDTPAIIKAITASNPWDVIYFPTGNYYLDPNTSIVVNHPLVFRGDGPGKTIMTENARQNLEFSPVGGSWEGNITVSNWTGGLNKGDGASFNDPNHPPITLSSTTGFKVGEEIVLDELNDPTFASDSIANEGPSGDCQSCGRNDASASDPWDGGTTRVLQQIARITGIQGNNITIDEPIYITHKAYLAPQVWAWGGNMHYAGIENMTINENAHSDSVYFSFCSSCWIKDVEAVNIGLNAVYLLYDYQNEVRDNFIHASNGEGSGNYGIELDTTGSSLIQNNIMDDVGPVITNTPSEGNVIAYNYMINLLYEYGNTLAGSLVTHGPHSYMNLYEGNYTQQLLWDATHGSSGQNTAFRNYFSGYEKGLVAELIPVLIQAWNREETLVGNVLGTPGTQTVYEQSVSDYPVDAYNPIYTLGYWCTYAGATWCPSISTGYDFNTLNSLLRHGNYDYVTNSTHWEPTIATQHLPNSLYLANQPSWFTTPWGTTPFPAIGPDVKGGQDTAGLVTKIPAQLCYENQNLAGTGTFNPTTCYNSATFKYGDTDLNGSITVNDSTIALSASVSPGKYSALQLQAAMVSGVTPAETQPSGYDAWLIAEYWATGSCTQFISTCKI